MSTQPVLIEDDDVDMESVIIVEDDNINSELPKTLVETIDLDDETPIDNKTEAATENVRANETKIFLNKSELSFINNLKNNKLMDKIVTCCLNMPNALGMTRVINRTVLPLYRDAHVRFKESSTFRKLLKNTFKSLIKDPDHKFLHIKTLCEELKCGRLGRKVPFVTLATNLNNHGKHFNGREIESSSRVIPQTCKHFDTHNNRNTAHSNKLNNHTSNRKRENMGAVKKKGESSNVLKTQSIHTKINKKNMMNKTDDIINLDNSDNESVINLDNGEARNYITNTEGTGNSNKGDSNINNTADANLETSNSNKINVREENQETNDSNIEHAATEEIVDSNTGNATKQVQEETEDCNKENKKLSNEINNKSDGISDYDLLIPQNHVEIVIEKTVSPTPSVNTKTVADIEQKIANYQQCIAELEEAEVSTDVEHMSPYVRSARMKKEVVQLYKQLCKIKGRNDKIVKRREIRLHVAEGYPPGPAKQLEEFLNSSIDSTGTVAFPDFADVVKCVFQANFQDKLGWDTQRVIREASSLFRHCGQALRKRRQKREYRDLLSLVKDKELTDDPAERDPSLQAKLEVNKQIAKVKEDDILERYVNMELGVHNNSVQFETTQDSTESESDSEPNVPINNVTTATVNEQCVTGESSKSNNINKYLDVRVANNVRTTSINNIIATTSTNNVISSSINNIIGATINSVCKIGDSSSINIIGASNNLHFLPENNNIFTPPMVNNQTHLGDSSRNTNDFNNLYVVSSNYTLVPYAQSNPVPCLNYNVTSNNSLYLTITPGGVPNTQTTGILEISAISSENHNTIIQNSDTALPVSVPSIEQNSIPCPANDLEQNPGPSMIEPNVDIKLEDKIKKEPIDVQGMLDELGDNFVCTVFDVEDPFLVVEISSDDFSDDDQ